MVKNSIDIHFSVVYIQEAILIFVEVMKSRQRTIPYQHCVARVQKQTLRRGDR